MSECWPESWPLDAIRLIEKGEEINAELLAFAKLVSDFFTDDSIGHATYLKERADNAIRKAEQQA